MLQFQSKLINIPLLISLKAAKLSLFHFLYRQIAGNQTLFEPPFMSVFSYKNSAEFIKISKPI